MDDHDGRETVSRGTSLLLENRKKAVITGVQEIHSFNENEVLLLSEAGKILLKGEQLHVRKLNLEKGEAEVEGAWTVFRTLPRMHTKKTNLF